MWEKSRGRFPSEQPDSKGWRWWTLVQDWSRLTEYAAELGQEDADKRGKKYVVPEEMEDSILRWVVAQWTFGLSTGLEPNITPKSFFTVLDGKTVSVQGRLSQNHPYSLKVKERDVSRSDYHALVLVNPLYQMAVLAGVIHRDNILEYPLIETSRDSYYEIPAEGLEKWFPMVDPERVEDIKNRPRRNLKQSLILGPRKIEDAIDYPAIEKDMVGWWSSSFSSQQWELESSLNLPVLKFSLEHWGKILWYSEHYKKYRKERNPATGLSQIAAKTAFGLAFNRCPDYHFSTGIQLEHLFLREDGQTLHIKGFDLSKGTPFLSEYEPESFQKIYGEELNPPDFYGLIGIDLQKHWAVFYGTTPSINLKVAPVRETKTDGIDIVVDGIVVKYKWKRQCLQVEELSLDGWNPWFPHDRRLLHLQWPLMDRKPLTLVG